MKKYFLIVLLLALVLVVTGCGSKNQLKCTGSYTEGGTTMKAEIVADFTKDDKLIDANVVYDLKDETTANQYCSLFKLMEDAEKGISVKCSGSKITIEGFAKMENEYGDQEFSTLVGKTKEEFKKAIETENLTCK